MITKAYTPFLEPFSLTYPQYLVLLVLWEQDSVSIRHISQKLFLETNTLTPLLKRMEKNGIITRRKSKIDERSVIIELTKKGKQLEEELADTPKKLGKHFQNSDISVIKLKKNIDQLLEQTVKSC